MHVNPTDLSLPQPTKPEPVNSCPAGPGATLPSEALHTWLRMESSLTQAVLAKTEEELLGGLAALMRNKVETEKAARRLTQILVETDQAQKELERIRQQVRQAEDELAFRLDEQQRAKDQVAENQTSLRAQGEHAAGQWDLWSALRAETERLRRELSQ